MEKIIIIYRTFDMFHIGHVKLRQGLKLYSTKVSVVAISADKFNNLKVEKVLIHYKQRVQNIRRYDINIFIIGNNWIRMLFLERTEDISRNKFKKDF